MIFDETSGIYVQAEEFGRVDQQAERPPLLEGERRKDAAAALLGVRVSLLSIQKHQPQTLGRTIW